MNFRQFLAVLFAAAACCTAGVFPLMAADTSTPVAPTGVPVQAAHVESAQVALIRRLAERGAISPEDAAELIKLSEADEADARVQTALTALASAQADAARVRAEAASIQATAARSAAIQNTGSQATAVLAPPPAGSPSSTAAIVAAPVPVVTFNPPKIIDAAIETVGAVASAPTSAVKNAAAEQVRTTTPARNDDDDSVRVTYVPEVVKEQLREEIKNDVLDQAKKEHWATPHAVPEWVSRFTLYGDFRFRYEGIYNHQQNDNTGSFPNFNSINTGSPFDTTGSVFSPQYNVDQDRSRLRLRARLGAAVDLGDGFTSGFRFATGENNSPVTQNQSLGAAGSGQGGNFSKYALWLDRSFLRYQSESDLSRAFTFTLGRFENPFLSTTILWADDLGFDGGVLTIPTQIHYDGVIIDTIKPYIVVGAFPIFNTDLNFATNQPAKIKSNDKWLAAAQFGLDLAFKHDFKAKLGLAYYYFTKSVGKLSTPYTPITSSDAGDTDARRPAFAQKGNTYMALRDIIGDSTNSYGTSNQWQYYGLAAAFRDMACDIRLDYNHFEPFQVSLVGEYVKNMGFDRAKILARSPVNNLGISTTDFIGGGAAWIAGLRLGDALLQKRWDWALNINYRQVESDAVIDGFCDSDFGGGGTNVKGLTLGANLALSKRVIFGVRWMSSTQVDGPTSKNDILQIDLNAKF